MTDTNITATAIQSIHARREAARAAEREAAAVQAEAERLEAAKAKTPSRRAIAAAAMAAEAELSAGLDAVTATHAARCVDLVAAQAEVRTTLEAAAHAAAKAQAIRAAIAADRRRATAPLESAVQAADHGSPEWTAARELLLAAQGPPGPGAAHDPPRQRGRAEDGRDLGLHAEAVLALGRGAHPGVPDHAPGAHGWIFTSSCRDVKRSLYARWMSVPSAPYSVIS